MSTEFYARKKEYNDAYKSIFGNSERTETLKDTFLLKLIKETSKKNEKCSEDMEEKFKDAISKMMVELELSLENDDFSICTITSNGIYWNNEFSGVTKNTFIKYWNENFKDYIIISDCNEVFTPNAFIEYITR